MWGWTRDQLSARSGLRVPLSLSATPPTACSCFAYTIPADSAAFSSVAVFRKGL